jgi:hypothetical protein
MSESRRGEAPAISSSRATPAAVSMSACTRSGARPVCAAASAPSSRRSTNSRSPRLSTFGTMIESGPRAADAIATMSA